MNIIIAGDGEVGMHLAEALVRSNHNITIVDPHEELLKMMESHSDLMTITGDSTSTAVLQRANVKKADLMIAVLHDEHINLLTGIIAKKLGAKKVIARVNTMENLSPEVWRMYQDLGIDGLLSPEDIAAQEIISLLKKNASSETYDFAGGNLQLFRVPHRSHPPPPKHLCPTRRRGLPGGRHGVCGYQAARHQGHHQAERQETYQRP